MDWCGFIWFFTSYFLLTFYVFFASFPAVDNIHLLSHRPVELPVGFRDPVHHFMPFYNSTEDNMCVVKSRGFIQGNVELTRVCILLPTIRHGQQVPLIMLVLVIFIVEDLPVDALSASAIPIDNIPCLDDQIWDYPVEMVSLVTKLLALGATACFPGAELTEIF